MICEVGAAESRESLVESAQIGRSEDCAADARDCLDCGGPGACRSQPPIRAGPPFCVPGARRCAHELEVHGMTVAAPVSAGVATLTVDGQTYELPIIEGTEGERAIDIRSLRSTSGLITLDPGYGNTGSTLSEITFINGEEGILRYRGYPIGGACHEGDLPRGLVPPPLRRAPDARRARRLHREDHLPLAGARGHPPHVPRVPAGRAPDGSVTAAVTGALSTFYQDSLDPLDPDQVEISTFRLLAKLPTICSNSRTSTRSGSRSTTRATTSTTPPTCST